MFIATLSNGKTIVEGKDADDFDGCPDGITSLQLSLPHKVFRIVAGKTQSRNSAIAIGKYAKYYSAKNAVADILSIGSADIQSHAPVGEVTEEVIAGIDEKRNEVVYITLNIKTGDITVDKFDFDKWVKSHNVNTDLLKKGII